MAIDRTQLIERIKEIGGLTNDERSSLLELLRTTPKYGLVWENKPEDVEAQMQDELPVLSEVKDRAIISDAPDAPNHILIEGDNLHALTALTYTHEGKIDVIYIDPPYNTGNKDFIYNDSFVDREDGYRHSKWLSFMAKRLRIAKRLLSEKGVIFISIDDNEQAQLKLLCDQIYGEERNEATITYVRKTSGKQDSSNFVKSTEYILVYSNSPEWVASTLVATEKVTDRYNKVDEEGRRYRETDLRKTGNADRRIDRPLMFYPFYYNPTTGDLKVCHETNSFYSENGYIEIFPIKPDGSDGRWRWALNTSQANIENIVAKEMPKYKGKYTIYEKDYIDKKEAVRTVKEHTAWNRTEFNSDNAMADFKELGFGNQDFPFPKSTDLIKHIVYLSNFHDSIILDFFAGSGTTLHATMQLNAEDGGKRRCILVTNNENGICENVTYERNKRVIEGYTTPKGVEVPGLKDNNLRYYRTAFVPRERSQKNMRQLVAAATDLLCIKNDLYTETGQLGGRKMRPSLARHFKDGDREMLIIYDDQAIPYITEMLKSVDVKTPILTYVFSPNNYPYTDEFYEVADKVKLCALPAAIYDAYRKVLKKPKPRFLETESENVVAAEEEDTLGGLFDTNNEEGGNA